MRFALIAAIAATAVPISATAAIQAPFAAQPVGDADLAASYGMASPALKSKFRLSDELSIISLRQTASIGSIIKDLWLIDFASPLIAANVRAIDTR